MISIFFWLAAIILGGSLLWSLYLLGHHSRFRLLKPLNMLMGGVFLSGILLFYPAYFLRETDMDMQSIKAILMSVYSSLRLFAAEGDYDVIAENIGSVNIRSIYLMLASILTFAAPIMSVSFVLSFFSNLSATTRYWRAFWKDAYIFSALNECSLALANDIKVKHPGAAVVFTNVSEDDETATDFLEQAKELHAICFKPEIQNIHLGFHSAKKGLWLFAISEDEDENIHNALRIIEQYGSKKNSNLYVFSTGIESEALLTSAQNKVMKVRRVDAVNSLVNRVLYEEGHRLFEGDLPIEGGEKVITSLVIGMGKHGTAMMKALSWYCQMEGYRVHIHGFDQDPLAEDRFAAQCPELLDLRFNGVYAPGDAHYMIQIHSGIQVDTKAFVDQIHSINNANYVLVSLGDDTTNIRVAMELRVLFEQCGAKPKIQAIVYSAEKKAALQGLCNFKGQLYDIDFIGDQQTSYSTDVIIDSELEADALRRHLRWDKESLFWGYDYNYRSSIALAVHSRAKQLLGIAGANKEDADLTDDERLALEDMEHRRWNAYMRSGGYIYSGSPEIESRNDLGRMHNNLIPYQNLSEDDKRKDSRAASK